MPHVQFRPGVVMYIVTIANFLMKVASQLIRCNGLMVLNIFKG